MDRDVTQQTAHGSCGQPSSSRCAASNRTSTRRVARDAWLIRAAAAVYLIAAGVIAYLIFSAV